LKLGLGTEAEHAYLELRRQGVAGHLGFHGERADLQHQQALRVDAKRPRRQDRANTPALRGRARSGAGPSERGKAGGLNDHGIAALRYPMRRDSLSLSTSAGGHET